MHPRRRVALVHKTPEACRHVLRQAIAIPSAPEFYRRDWNSTPPPAIARRAALE
jgi:hypothetical protein